MAPPTRQIPQEEWNSHEDTIKRLYYVDKLPLQSKKKEKRTLIKVMEDEYGFLSSPAQYEAKFRLWGLAKNLGKREWQKLFWQQEELQQQGRDARIVVSGVVVEEPSRKRARRWVEPEQHIGYTIPPERQAYVEIRNGTGPWSRYTSNEDPVQLPESNQNPVHENIGVQGNDNATVSVSTHVPVIRDPHEDGGQQAMVSMGLNPPLPSNLSGPDFNWDYDGYNFPINYQQNPQQILQNQFPYPLEFHDAYDASKDGLFNRSFPFNEVNFNSWLNDPRLQSEILPLSKGYEDASLEQGHFEATNIRAYDGPNSSQELQQRSKGIAEALLQRAKEVMGDNAILFRGTDLPDVEDVTDSLESLLPEDNHLETNTPNSQIAERGAKFAPGFRALLYSITNGFAGLRNIPRSSILRLIRDDQQIRSHLIKLLNMSSYDLAKPLADNLFRAAVESCDPEALAMIMSITRNRPEIDIHPDNIACELDGRNYTPVELAAKFQNIEIVNALLTAKADPNKTYSNEETDDRGALELAIRKWDKPEQVDLKLVKLLLNCGAEVRISLTEAIVLRGHDYTELFQMLINEIPDSQHSAYFKSRDSLSRNRVILEDVIELLNNKAANDIVQRFFDACNSTNCGTCILNDPKSLEVMLALSTKRGNLDLVNFLVPHTKEKQLALAAAVRIGNTQLINFLLNKGATVDGPGGRLDKGDSDKYGSCSPPITTPLAEAIRAQDRSQIQELEQRGALTCISREDHFMAAVFAAAETGNVAFLRKILELVPDYRRQRLTAALTMAIQNNHTEAALILLNAGASVNQKSFSFGSGFPLREALKRQNKRVVDVILESDVKVGHLDLAVKWGDPSIIQDLALMGADLNDGALTAAVTTGNKPLVDQLIQLGAKVNTQSLSGSSPLEAAVKNGDQDMIVFLMSQGASVTNSNAFLYAAKNNPVAYSMLLSALGKLSPVDRKGFGGDLLIHFIAQNDLEAVDALIKAKADINKVCWTSKERTIISPLGFAIKHNKGDNHALVRKLLQAGGDPNSIAAKSDTGPHLDFVRVPETPLLLAIQIRDEEMVEILINAGAHVNRPARRGIKRTPLQEACKINSFKMAKLLLLKGANVDDPAAERGGHTALQLAAINGSIRIVTMLLDNGADPHAASAKVRGRTAIEGAAENGCLEVLRILCLSVFPKTFDQRELQRARGYAVGRGHRSCVAFIDSLLDAPSSGLAPLIDFELSLGEDLITGSH